MVAVIPQVISVSKEHDEQSKRIEREEKGTSQSEQEGGQEPAAGRKEIGEYKTSQKAFGATHLPIVSASNTVVEPLTVMIKVMNTFITYFTVFCFGTPVDTENTI